MSAGGLASRLSAIALAPLIASFVFSGTTSADSGERTLSLPPYGVSDDAGFASECASQSFKTTSNINGAFTAEGSFQGDCPKQTDPLQSAPGITAAGDFIGSTGFEVDHGTMFSVDLVYRIDSIAARLTKGAGALAFEADFSLTGPQGARLAPEKGSDFTAREICGLPKPGSCSPTEDFSPDEHRRSVSASVDCRSLDPKAESCFLTRVFANIRFGMVPNEGAFAGSASLDFQIVELTYVWTGEGVGPVELTPTPIPTGQSVAPKPTVTLTPVAVPPAPAVPRYLGTGAAILTVFLLGFFAWRLRRG